MIALIALKSAVNLLSPGALSNITPLTCDSNQHFLHFSRYIPPLSGFYIQQINREFYERNSDVFRIDYLERRVGLLHRKADVLIEERAAVAEDVEKYRVLFQPLVRDHLQQTLADVRHLVAPPKQTLHRRRVTQRDATARRRAICDLTHR